VTRPASLVFLVCCLALAGCVGTFAQSGQPAQSEGQVGDALGRQVSVSLSNWAETQYTVRVMLVAGPVERVTVSHTNGTNRTLAVDEEYYLPGRLTNVTQLSVAGRVIQSDVYRLDPDTHEHARHPDLPSNTTVVYTASPVGTDTVSGWNVLRCASSDDTHEVYVNLLSSRSVSVTPNCRG
jgi:hypothetical protein